MSFIQALMDEVERVSSIIRGINDSSHLLHPLKRKQIDKGGDDDDEGNRLGDKQDPPQCGNCKEEMYPGIKPNSNFDTTTFAYRTVTYERNAQGEQLLPDSPTVLQLPEEYQRALLGGKYSKITIDDKSSTGDNIYSTV